MPLCAGPMSRVQAIRDHHGTDCRFLNFKQGDTIFVYHKLTGKREDLWAGTVCLIRQIVSISKSRFENKPNNFCMMFFFLITKDVSISVSNFISFVSETVKSEKCFQEFFCALDRQTVWIFPKDCCARGTFSYNHGNSCGNTGRHIILCPPLQLDLNV